MAIVTDSNYKMDNLKKIKAIFFDLDNTLIPTRKADKLACNKLNEILRNEYNLNLDEANKTCTTYLKLFRQCPDNEINPIDEWRTQLFKKSLNNKYKDKAYEIYKRWLELRYKYLIIEPEIKSMLLKLKELNYLLCIISNGPSAAQWEKINKLQLKLIFNLILISGDFNNNKSVVIEKPNKLIFNKAIKYFNLNSNECCIIGDKLETDIKGGIQSNLGLTIWLPLNNNYTNTNIIKPNFIINKLTDLLKILLFNNNTTTTTTGFYDYYDSNSNSSDGS